MRKTVLLFCIVFRFDSYAQISAEAQGGKAGFWSALGVDQDLSAKWTSVTDLGYGRHSDPNNFEAMKRLGLNVITQDFVYKPNKHWRHYFSFGYWRRYSYIDDPPYDLKDAPYQFRNELRPFYKLGYRYNFARIRCSHLFRTDYRFYYNQDFSNSWPTPFEFRFRFQESMKFPLNQNDFDFFIITDEILTACDKTSVTGSVLRNWTDYQLTENRFSIYYKRVFIKDKLEMDFGLMHQYWRDKPGVQHFNTTYNLMIDVIIKNPFSKE